MVRAHNLRVDTRGGDLVADAVGAEEVVDSPAHVPLSRPGAEAPPAVGIHGIGVEVAEGVGEAGREQHAELFALLIGEAGVFVVGVGVFEVDLLMGHVHVAADDHGLLGVQRAGIGTEIILPGHAVVQALEPVLGVGHIDADQIEVFVFQRDAAALVAVGLGTDAHVHGEGGMPGEDGGTGVALLLGVVPVLLIAGEGKIDLPGLKLGLLQAEEVRIQGGKALFKALFHAGAKAVYVP